MKARAGVTALDAGHDDSRADGRPFVGCEALVPPVALYAGLSAELLVGWSAARRWHAFLAGRRPHVAVEAGDRDTAVGVVQA